MNHTLPIAMTWGKDSRAYFAHGAADRLIIFIHGFGGGALKTWKGMDSIIKDPRTATSDIVFYGYRSLTSPALTSSILFRSFLELAESGDRDWRDLIRKAGSNPDERAYREILIVAHSLGAVVTRRALLDGMRRNEAWAPITRLVLFGPAHMGTRLVDLQAELRSAPMQFLADLFTLGRSKMPVVTDLKEGSDFLQELNSETMDALNSGADVHIAGRVIFGESENVVVTRRFCHDPDPDVIPKHGHSSICKMPEAVELVGRHL